MTNLFQRRNLVLLGTVLTAIGLIAAHPAFQKPQAAGNEPQKKEKAKKEAAKQKIKGIPGSYIKPVQPDKETQAVLANIGVNSMAFEYSVPWDYKIIVKVLVLENDKKIVKSLSRVYRDATPSQGDDKKIFRIMRLDPREMKQDDRGKVRWTFTIDKSSFGERWEKDRYTATNLRQAWLRAKEKSNLELGKDYLVWNLKAYSKELRGVYPDSPTSFRMEVRVRIEKAGRDAWGHHASEYEDYIEREKKEAAEKARLNKNG